LRVEDLVNLNVEFVLSGPGNEKLNGVISVVLVFYFGLDTVRAYILKAVSGKLHLNLVSAIQYDIVPLIFALNLDSDGLADIDLGDCGIDVVGGVLGVAWTWGKGDVLWEIHHI